MKLSDFAALAGLCTKTVRRRIKDGRITRVLVTDGGQYLLAASAIEEFTRPIAR